MELAQKPPRPAFAESAQERRQERAARRTANPTPEARGTLLGAFLPRYSAFCRGPSAEGCVFGIIHPMKDWKTYALVILAAWCAWLTFKRERQAAMPSSEALTTTNFTDTPPAFDVKGTNLLWTADGDNGMVLDCYCKIAPLVPKSHYSAFQRCRLSFSKRGTLESAAFLPERVRIKASCQTDRVSHTSKIQ